MWALLALHRKWQVDCKRVLLLACCMVVMEDCRMVPLQVCYMMEMEHCMKAWMEVCMAQQVCCMMVLLLVCCMKVMAPDREILLVSCKTMVDCMLQLLLWLEECILLLVLHRKVLHKWVLHRMVLHKLVGCIELVDCMIEQEGCMLALVGCIPLWVRCMTVHGMMVLGHCKMELGHYKMGLACCKMGVVDFHRILHMLVLLVFSLASCKMVSLPDMREREHCKMVLGHCMMMGVGMMAVAFLGGCYTDLYLMGHRKLKLRMKIK